MTDPAVYAHQRKDTQTETAVLLHSSQTTMHNNQKFSSAAYTTRILNYKLGRDTDLASLMTYCHVGQSLPLPYSAPLLLKMLNMNVVGGNKNFICLSISVIGYRLGHG